MEFKWIKKIAENTPDYLDVQVEDGLLEKAEHIVRGLSMRMEDAVSLFLRRLIQSAPDEVQGKSREEAEQLVHRIADLSVADMKTQPLLLPATDVLSFELLDYTLPPFVTFTKDYYGTQADIDAFFSSQREDNPDIDKNLRLVPVHMYGSRSSCIPSGHYDHTNMWGFPYIVWWDRIESVHIWIKHKDRYRRCLRTRILNLRYNTEFDGQLKRIDGQIWGHPHIIEHAEPFHFNRLYVTEKVFLSEEELKADMDHFDNKPLLKEWLNNIFADG